MCFVFVANLQKKNKGFTNIYLELMEVSILKRKNWSLYLVLASNASKNYNLNTFVL